MMTLLQLPRDVLNEIFSYLNSRYDIWHIERVSKTFKTISRERTVWYPPIRSPSFNVIFIANYHQLTIFTGHINRGSERLYSSKLKKFRVGIGFFTITGRDGNLSDHIRAYSLHMAREEVMIIEDNKLQMIIRFETVEIPKMISSKFGLIRTIRTHMKRAIINVSIKLKDLTELDTDTGRELRHLYFDLIGQCIDKLTIRIKSKVELDRYGQVMKNILNLLTVNEILIQSNDYRAIEVMSKEYKTELLPINT